MVTFFLHSWASGEERAWQEITGLPDGRYRMTVRVKTAGDFDSACLYAQSGEARFTCELAPGEEYAYIKFDGIQVTGGACEIGVVISASALAQLDMDQVVFEQK